MGGHLLESFVGCLAVQAYVGAMVDVVVPPLAAFVVKDVGFVDQDAVEHALVLFGVDAVGSLDLAIEPLSPGFDVGVGDALSRACQWKAVWNSAPLSVWMASTANGKRFRT
jgi:hypothetical protein